MYDKYVQTYNNVFTARVSHESFRAGIYIFISFTVQSSKTYRVSQSQLQPNFAGLFLGSFGLMVWIKDYACDVGLVVTASPCILTMCAKTFSNLYILFILSDISRKLACNHLQYTHISNERTEIFSY